MPELNGPLDAFDSRLAVVYGSDPDRSVRRVVESLQPFSGLTAGTRVVIKPNLVVSRRRWLGANTRPEVVEALIALLREHGVRSITVADGSGMGESATRAFELCGYAEIALRYGVRLLDIEHDRFVECSTGTGGPFSKLAISRTVAECDYLINVPVIKAHGQTRITCSLKNLKGVMPPRLKSGFHGVDLHRAIAQLAALLTPDFVLADGGYGDLSSELGGRPVEIGLMAAGFDPLALDCFAAATLGFAPGEIGHIAHYARARGLDPDTFRPEVSYLNRPAGPRVFRTETEGFRSYPCTVRLGSACSTCYANLRFALERLRDARLLSAADHYCIGRLEAGARNGAPGGRARKPRFRHARRESVAGRSGRTGPRTVAIGDCALESLTSEADLPVSGCPPSAEMIVDSVRRARSQ